MLVLNPNVSNSSLANIFKQKSEITLLSLTVIYSEYNSHQDK